ncbi:basic helix-loop-helix protein [Sporothrix eucalyptigena]|uniref:Basic helix-loop-helix protein n=1 Tax=Sporothrix eucalyptigena TaxID=1812306 RepID=A0ABP0D0X2_9PEZI
MAEAAAEQPPDLTPSSPPQKRKREPSSPDTRRSKRGAATTSAAPIDAAATAFMEGQPEPAADEFTNDGAAAEAPAPDAAGAEGAPAEANTANHADPALASSTAAAALGSISSMFPQLNVPAPTEESFANQNVDGGEHHGDTSAFSTGDVTQSGDLSLDVSNGVGKRPMSGIQAKPAVGSEEWHKMRKDNHKEVERRRRETINEGINELAKIVPGCEKNKGSILQRAVVFITQLKENETQNIEKWTLEKLLTEQAIAELSASNDKLKAEVDRLYAELETWKSVAENAGLQPPEKSEPSS